MWVFEDHLYAEEELYVGWLVPQLTTLGIPLRNEEGFAQYNAMFLFHPYIWSLNESSKLTFKNPQESRNYFNH